MGKYRVVFTPEADAEVSASYVWGVENWGEDRAKRWVRDLYSAIFDRVGTFPFACPKAPDSIEPARDVRHMILGRYRVLYEIQGETVVVLQLAGPFIQKIDAD